MRLVLDIDDVTAERLTRIAERKQISVERLAAAYVEEWADTDFVLLSKPSSRRGIYRELPRYELDSNQSVADPSRGIAE